MLLTTMPAMPNNIVPKNPNKVANINEVRCGVVVVDDDTLSCPAAPFFN